MTGKETRKAGLRLVREKLAELGLAVTEDSLTSLVVNTEKTVKIHSCQNKGVGNCWAISEDKGKAKNKANEVPFRVFVKLDGDRRIVQSFVWDRDSDQDLVDKHGKKYGFYPYRQKALFKWQKREGKIGWEWMKKALTR